MKTFTRLFFGITSLFCITTTMYSQIPEWKWAKSVGGNKSEMGSSTAIDMHGNIYVAGIFSSDSISFGNVTLRNVYSGIGQGSDIYIVKYDPQGNVLWAKSSGGKAADVAHQVILDNEEYLYILGSTDKGVIDRGGADIEFFRSYFITKYDTTGKLIGVQQLIDSSSAQINDFTRDQAGNFIVCGEFYADSITLGNITFKNSSEFLGTDVFIAKYDNSAQVIWAKSAGGTGRESIESITTDSAGNIYATGAFSSDSITFGDITLQNDTLGQLLIIKYDQHGSVIWAKSDGEKGYAHSSSITIDGTGNVFVAGYFIGYEIELGDITLLNTSTEGYDIFIAKYDTLGNIVWAQSAGEEGWDNCTKIIADNNNLYSIGEYTSSSIQFGSFTLKKGAEDKSNIFIAKYDVNGNVMWAKTIGGKDYDRILGAVLDTKGNLYVSGYFVSPFISFGNITLKISEHTWANVYREDMFIAKLETMTTSTETETIDRDVNIFPNPTNSIFHISKLELGTWNITIYTVDGQSVYQSVLTETTSIIDLTNKAKGIYIFKLEKDNEIIKTGKLILE